MEIREISNVYTALPQCGAFLKAISDESVRHVFLSGLLASSAPVFFSAVAERVNGKKNAKPKTQNSKLKTQNSYSCFRSARQRGGRLLLPRPHADTRHRQRALLPVVVPSCGEVRTARRRQRDIAHRDAEPTLGTDSRRRLVCRHLSRGAQRTCGVEAPPRRAHHQHCRGRHRRLCRPWTQDARVRLQGGRLCVRAGAVRHARKHHRRLLLLVGAAVPHRLLRRRGRHHTHVRGGRPALESCPNWRSSQKKSNRSCRFCPKTLCS